MDDISRSDGVSLAPEPEFETPLRALIAEGCALDTIDEIRQEIAALLERFGILPQPVNGAVLLTLDFEEILTYVSFPSLTFEKDDASDDAVEVSPWRESPENKVADLLFDFAYALLKFYFRVSVEIWSRKLLQRVLGDDSDSKFEPVVQGRRPLSRAYMAASLGKDDPDRPPEDPEDL